MGSTAAAAEGIAGCIDAANLGTKMRRTPMSDMIEA